LKKLGQELICYNWEKETKLWEERIYRERGRKKISREREIYLGGQIKREIRLKIKLAFGRLR